MEGYEIIRKIGKGAFGKVFLARRKSDEMRFAIRKMDLSKFDENDRLRAATEVQILKGLDHPNIVKYFDSFLEGNSFYFVMEFMEGGDLRKMVEKRGSNLLSEAEVLYFFSRILSAMKYLYERKIIHGDLKTGNIFLTRSGEVKVGDYGLARLFSDSKPEYYSRIGTANYIAPEFFVSSDYTVKADIWSFGCILYELCCFRPPFEDSNAMALMHKIVDAEPGPIESKYSRGMRELIYRMLSKAPDARPSMGQISNAKIFQLIILGESAIGLVRKEFNSDIEVPEGITKIEKEAFKESKMSSVKLPNTLIDIGDRAFNGCSSLKSIIIPPRVTQIGDSAFHGCSTLESIAIPSSVTQIGDSAFHGCSTLESIEIPSSVTQIGDSAFDDCFSLKSFTIHPSVT